MPITRKEEFKAISREHHHGLLLCWKIRTGFKKEIAPERIKAYAQWFFETHLLSHFAIEEQYVFTILGTEHPLVEKAIAEHQIIKHLFEANTDISKNLTLIADTLESHIRFEERTLFNEIQAIATDHQLQQVKMYHIEEKFLDNICDPFWL